mmetsp:Transcript_61346/g.146123  ORF Transcript_61346/g.146123 Transcript_61346/m.146123 type:complete len:408 (+) Transcript_61346:94-1317(+)|eukprot:CAMPEP_0178444318 /NCGR_PEP_ID=MMETSP0689_2-20121128/39425_1 /TAXON_ID=160604 /ORGANISM="Amphidinium massartii, Strain CS-259" /LENGTH=407 /DNA_ID=CAMNT_0020068505 /DNA_START=78 /DNA_END=1301 /DNA_ORIENTATION=-
MSVVEGLPFPDDKKAYILNTLDPILEEMVSDVLTEMPKVPLDFMINWLRKRSGTTGKERKSVKEKNAALKQELNAMTSFVSEAGTGIQRPETADHDEEEEEEDDDDDCDELPPDFIKPESQKGVARQSVSAEAYGQWNQKKAFTPPCYTKSEEQKERLSQTLLKSFMFQSLEPADMNTITNALVEKTFAAGEKVITEGENGNYLFVIESGSLDCIKVIDGQEKVVKTCDPGDVFGELALLYNCPRAASVIAKDNCVCWQLDRETFNHIVKDAAVKRREKYDNFLKSVTLLSSMGAYERSQIADALKSETYSKGDVIVNQDEPGDKFYIVEDGEMIANKTVDGSAIKVMDYKAGDYFGELALLKNQPRAASIIVTSDTAKVLSLGRQSFTKMLGPLQHILAKNVTQYK